MKKRIKIFETIYRLKMIPIFHNNDIEKSKSIVKALSEGGAHCIEYTNRSSQALSTFIELSRYVKKKLPHVSLGVGSITHARLANSYINAGADFIVSPCLDKELFFFCNQQKIAFIPGCSTTTEIHHAEKYGAEICKIFPGTILNPDFIKAVLGPMPWSSLMPTGGVNVDEKSIKAWFDSGVVAVGLGSQLISNKIINNKNYSLLAEETQNILKIINKNLINS